ncbi:E3 ubiquitin-protein ligase UBR2 [Planococcus citri]|uniref:E3 ubiquitin-protein ligase UBR2 n=1 Tax=Planococcus citri TaxID=170843 RepID=UPI0031F752C9
MSGDEDSMDMEHRYAKSNQPRGFPSVAQVVGIWREKFEQGTLNESHFKEHWRLYVPQVLCLDPSNSSYDRIFDEENVLFAPLEQFICGDGNTGEILDRVQRLDEPSTVCGKVFKMSEPTYHCRECGTDPTCVLCVECFKKSAHKNHKYKMSMSNGGGCCDCGDTEAWKSDPYCSVHIAGTLSQASTAPDASSSSSPATGESSGGTTARGNFPEDMAQRTRLMFGAILRYAYHLLKYDDSPELPSDLRLKEIEEDPLSFLDTPDSYCTVLYNDETHTFDHVITTLSKVIKCNQRDAMDYVTNIDREGRAVVKISTFQYCTELKHEVERITSRTSSKPLKVLVKHSHVIAHQLYAIKLLARVQKILSYSKHFRRIFSEIVLETKSSSSASSASSPPLDISILEGVFRADSSLWKSARVHWHRLFISGMLKEYEHKKAFAKLFTKHYGSIMQDYIRDDHDHSFSVASLAVQIFTVPTIAHYLIAYQDVLFVLLNTFLSECNANQKDGKLEFQRNEHSSAVTFKRAQFIIYDLHYLLSTVPEPERWTNELRKGFSQGLSLFLRLLCLMQGMDAVTRQVGQHMEYEPEWETAFNLHIKLSPVITLMIKWCGTDKKILTKAYRATLKKLLENPCADLSSAHCQVRELANHSTSCVVYDVSTQPVSIHLPLSRFLAGLHVQLERFSLNFYSSEFQFTPKQTLEEIIEPVLRTQVMIAQVHANLWRRNGYSILHQIYFYHNVKCRNEMLNKDIIMLQIGASLIESNDFLIHLLNKFNLMNWADSEFEGNSYSSVAAAGMAATSAGSTTSTTTTSTSTTTTTTITTSSSPKKAEEETVRQTITLVEEFLTLLVTIVSERYVVGIGKVTEKDCVKKEIMQQLCIKPLSHSELSKVLPDSDHNDVTVDSIIDEIATFEKPSTGNGKGMYKLKPQYYDQYNVFYYHYTREELSRSEEAQRRRRKEQGLLDCCPPPTLPPLTESFIMLVNMLQCDVMFYLMQLILKRACDLKARSFSESQLHRVLHLIGYALHEEESARLDYFMFTERCEKWGVLRYLEELQSSNRVEAHRDLIKWTANKYRFVSHLSAKNKRMNESRAAAAAASAEDDERRRSGREDEKMELGEGEESNDQSACLSADKATCEMSWECSENEAAVAAADDQAQKKEKERIAKLAAERRMKIMAQMSSAQQSFIKEHAQLYEEATKSDTLATSGASGSGGAGECMAWEASNDENVEFPIAVGPNQTQRSSPDPGYICILCQEHQIVRTDAPAMVYGAFVQKSAVLVNEVHTMALDKHRKVDVSAAGDDATVFLTSALNPSPFTSICGHVMHSTCWEKYFNNISTKENRRPYRLRQPISFDVEKNEFLCPLCESLNNTVLPVLPPLKNMSNSSTTLSLDHPQFSFAAWLKSIIVATDKKQQEILKRKTTTTLPLGCIKETAIFNESLLDDSESSSLSNVTDLTTTGASASNNVIANDNTRVAATDAAATSDDSSQQQQPEDTVPTAAEDDDDLSLSQDTDQMEILLFNSVAESNASGSGAEQASSSSYSGPVLSPTLTSMIQKYCKSVCVKGLGSSSDIEHNSVLYCWKCCAYTIHVVEMLLRSESRPLLRYLPTRQKQCMKALIRLSALQEICGNQRVINNYAVTLLGIVFDNSHIYEDTCILDWDPFGMLVPLVMCLPSLFCMATPSPLPCGSVLELYTLKLMLISTVAQILIGLRSGNLESAAVSTATQVPANPDEAAARSECLKMYLKIITEGDEKDTATYSETIDTAALWQRVTELCIPFLRCCCLFFRFLTNVPAADCLSQPEGDTYENMCKYLGLPTTCDQLLDDPFVLKVFKKWTINWRRKQTLHNSSIRFETYLNLRRLIQLPDDYSELINSVSMFTCPNSDREDSRNPTVCLVCGTILCSQSYCCQKELNGVMVGACAYHAQYCGAGAGIFLRMRECEILLLSCFNRGCFLAPPYVDEYGETDQGLRRGNPLKLCLKRYKKLENIWLSHSIHEEVSRSLESTHSLAVTQWQHL